MSVVALVLGILLVVGLVQAAIWIPLVRRWKKGERAYWAALDESITAGDETVVIPRESGIYRGGTGAFPTVKGNGSIMLTTHRLIFRKLTGGPFEVPRGEIVGAHEAKTFLGAVVGNKVHLVVETASGAQVGFFVNDLARWLSALAAPSKP